MQNLLLYFSILLFSQKVGYTQGNWVDHRAQKIYSSSRFDLKKKAYKLQSLSKIFSKNPSVYYYASCINLEIIPAIKNNQTQISKYNKVLKTAEKSRKNMQGKDTITEGFLALKLKAQLLSFLSSDISHKEQEALLYSTVEFFNPNLNYQNKYIASNQLKGELFNDTVSGLPSNSLYIPAFKPLEENLFLEILNRARIEKGMSPLELDEDLSRACRYHAFDMATEDYFSHQSQDRSRTGLAMVSSAFDRIQIFAPFCVSCSENIAAGKEKAYDTYLQWYNSPGHYRNMFNPKAKKIGVGSAYNKQSLYGTYWVMNTSDD